MSATSGESDVAIQGGFILVLQSLALHWRWPSDQKMCLPPVSSDSLAGSGLRATACLGALREMQSQGFVQLVSSFQKC